MSAELFALLQSMDDTPIVREDYQRVAIPYPGSKVRSLQKLIPLLPYDDIWVDAFGGTGIVTQMRRKSKLEVFNDKHAGIVAFYRCVRQKEKLRELLDRLGLTIHSREDFIWSRETWEHDPIDDVERAARWYYVQVYSFSAKGEYFGRCLKPGTFAGKLHDKLELFEAIHERFRNVQVECSDWRHLLKDYDSAKTVFYFDPPYVGKNIYIHNMTRADHIEMCQRIFQCQGFVALSGYENDIYNKFPWHSHHEWSVHVSMTTKSNNSDDSETFEIGKSGEIEHLWIKEFS